MLRAWILAAVIFALPTCPHAQVQSGVQSGVQTGVRSGVESGVQSGVRSGFDHRPENNYRPRTGPLQQLLANYLTRGRELFGANLSARRDRH